jgi:hypothetical protein
MAGHAAYLEKMQNPYVLGGSAEGNREIDRHKHGLQEKEVGSTDVEWIQVVQNWFQ